MARYAMEKVMEKESGGAAERRTGRAAAMPSISKSNEAQEAKKVDGAHGLVDARDAGEMKEVGKRGEDRRAEFTALTEAAVKGPGTAGWGSCVLEEAGANLPSRSGMEGDLDLERASVEKFMEKQVRLNVAARGWIETAYYYLGSDYRAGGGLRYTLSYMSQMGGWSILDYALNWAGRTAAKEARSQNDLSAARAELKIVADNKEEPVVEERPGAKAAVKTIAEEEEALEAEAGTGAQKGPVVATRTKSGSDLMIRVAPGAETEAKAEGETVAEAEFWREEARGASARAQVQPTLFDYLRLGYASYLSSWALVNSGRAETGYGYWFPAIENDGGAGGGFEPMARARGWLGKWIERGAWYYSAEEDVGYCGAIRTAAAVVADDPVFGLVALGGKLEDKGDRIEVVPRDGLRVRFHLIASPERRLHVEFEQGRLAKEKPVLIKKDLSEIVLQVEEREVAEERASAERRAEQVRREGPGVELVVSGLGLEYKAYDRAGREIKSERLADGSVRLHPSSTDLVVFKMGT